LPAFCPLHKGLNIFFMLLMLLLREKRKGKADGDEGGFHSSPSFLQFRNMPVKIRNDFV